MTIEQARYVPQQQKESALEYNPPILPEKALRETLLIHYGRDPLILTVSHDGDRREIGGIALPYDPTSKFGDLATAIMTRDIVDALRAAGKDPTVVMQQIQRAHRTPQIKDHFTETVRKLTERMDRNSRGSSKGVLLMDIHGFSTQPPLGNFDLIIGTAHRKAVQEDVDYAFRDFMEEHDYDVYVPSEMPREGEIFAAETKDTIVGNSITKKWDVLGTSRIQIEIARRFRVGEEAEERGPQLSRDIGAFMIEWYRR